MEKWADYLISALRYEDSLNSKVISHFKIHHDNGNSVGKGSTWTNQEVLEAILRGDTFLTIHKTNGGKWKKGKEISISKSDELSLSTSSKNLIEYNLINIPEF